MLSMTSPMRSMETADAANQEETVMNRTQSWARILSIVACAACGIALSACNTMEGAGEDVEDAGDAIEDAVDD